ncbi:unnamed protein product [Vitrella brassicaformis CCMP3155]|uniref:N-acetyltransferase domain-containing protein n=2 Tax=Vitrella brassicaformis TaxID=1169539 RepID=A0A0G4EQM9_VITBC|nr:unnamed protein product [Vitrella brassicaformis CCMP3155]|mmetsp:Transcript_20491/g.58511  ORF Transcript_20491/g.58511 Transcript_20491/m.58511 type:complete len:173 (+) Transcript_20491:103-621(+)|eukprot:CEL99543.1 unnamed protein product [Vitrella brassicaformis CCMP3155]
MVTIRLLSVDDLFKFNNVNLDAFTETFRTDFYLHYLTNWPECCVVAATPDDTIAGYIIGKVEGSNDSWHGHVTALSIAPDFRKTGLAQRLMAYLEDVCDRIHGCFFMDLFVRPSNTVAVRFYRKLGYVVWRVVSGYYSGSEDAYDMRRPLARDRDGKSIADAHDFKTRGIKA